MLDHNILWKHALPIRHETEGSWPYRTGAMQDLGCEFPRRPLLRLSEKWLKRSPDGALLLTSTPKQGFYAPFFDRGPPRFEAVEAFRTVSLGNRVNKAHSPPIP
jgi:hypothetical protein